MKFTAVVAILLSVNTAAARCLYDLDCGVVCDLEVSPQTLLAVYEVLLPAELRLQS